MSGYPRWVYIDHTALSALVKGGYFDGADCSLLSEGLLAEVFGLTEHPSRAAAFWFATRLGDSASETLGWYKDAAELLAGEYKNDIKGSE